MSLRKNVSDKTGLCFFPAFDWAISPTHPEREERLLYTYDQIVEEGVLDLPSIREYAPVSVDEKHIWRTHFLVPDLASNITPSHRVAVGGVIALADAFMKGEIKNAFALIRPPGHHAFKMVYGNRGFCNINNEAILVDYLRSVYGIKRIAIVDTDCHHGDGTQDIFWNDPDVLCISMHQDGRTIFPGSGAVNEAGGPSAYGYTLNFPLPPNTGEKGFLQVLEKGIMPILEEFKPEIIINSAGQDNIYNDPITNMNFSAQGYARLTEILKPDIAVLEGGYSIESSLPYTNLGILLALAGEDYSFVHETDYAPSKVTQTPEHDKYIEGVIAQVLDIWKNRGKGSKERGRVEEGFYTRTKRVFYDTDGIVDLQLEKTKQCPHCAGFMVMDSKCRERGYHVLALSVPFGACAACEEEASQLAAQEGKSKAYDYVYLQQQKQDYLKIYPEI